MQFQVPQFIEVEDKIFGPLTFKQFIYIVGGAGASYIIWRVLPIYIGGPIIAAICGLSASLAFVQLNGRPFITNLENGFFFLIHSKLYLWSNAPKKIAIAAVAGKPSSDGRANVYVPRLSESKLRELSWSLDIKERIAQGIATDAERESSHPEEPLPLTRTPQQVKTRMIQDTL